MIRNLFGQQSWTAPMVSALYIMRSLRLPACDLPAVLWVRQLAYKQWRPLAGLHSQNDIHQKQILSYNIYIIILTFSRLVIMHTSLHILSTILLYRLTYNMENKYIAYMPPMTLKVVIQSKQIYHPAFKPSTL